MAVQPKWNEMHVLLLLVTLPPCAITGSVWLTPVSMYNTNKNLVGWSKSSRLSQGLSKPYHSSTVSALQSPKGTFSNVAVKPQSSTQGARCTACSSPLPSASSRHLQTWGPTGISSQDACISLPKPWIPRKARAGTAFLPLLPSLCRTESLRAKRDVKYFQRTLTLSSQGFPAP